MNASKKRIFYTILQILALFVMVYAGYQLYDSYQKVKYSSDLKEEIKAIAKVDENHNTIDFDALKKVNEDIVGWINIPDTEIDYPIVQGSDNAYYLNHSFQKESNIIGSIFMDVNNDLNFQDAHTLIYGHNVPEGDMFKDLEKFKDETFFKEHQTIYLYTPNAAYELAVISFYQTTETSDTYQYFKEHDSSFVSYGKGRLSLSMYPSTATFQDNDSIITLSTCSYESGKGVYTDLRYVLQTKIIKRDCNE